MGASSSIRASAVSALRGPYWRVALGHGLWGRGRWRRPGSRAGWTRRAGSRGRSVTSSPESVTARLIFFSMTFGSSSRSMVPCGELAGLGHLVGRALQVHDPGAGLGDVGLGDHEGLAVAGVEALGDVPGDLEVLALVVAHRDPVGVVHEDVGRHQRRVGEQAAGDELGPVRLVLELGHAAELAEGHRALHDPGQLGVLVDVALHEQRAPVGVEADGQQLLGQRQRGGAERRRGPGGRSGRGGRPRSRRSRGCPGRSPSCAGPPAGCRGGPRRWA